MSQPTQPIKLPDFVVADVEQKLRDDLEAGNPRAEFGNLAEEIVKIVLSSTPAGAPQAPDAGHWGGLHTILEDMGNYLARKPTEMQWQLAVMAWYTALSKLPAPTLPGSSTAPDLADAIDKENARWQEAIHPLIEKLTGSGPIDASGSDSGDPLDYTLTLIEIAFIRMEEAAGSSTEAGGLDAFFERNKGKVVDAKVFADGIQKAESEILAGPQYHGNDPLDVEPARILDGILCAFSDRISKPLRYKILDRFAGRLRAQGGDAGGRDDGKALAEYFYRTLVEGDWRRKAASNYLMDRTLPAPHQEKEGGQDGRE